MKSMLSNLLYDKLRLLSLGNVSNPCMLKKKQPGYKDEIQITDPDKRAGDMPAPLFGGQKFTLPGESRQMMIDFPKKSWAPHFKLLIKPLIQVIGIVGCLKNTTKK